MDPVRFSNMYGSEVFDQAPSRKRMFTRVVLLITLLSALAPSSQGSKINKSMSISTISLTQMTPFPHSEVLLETSIAAPKCRPWQFRRPSNLVRMRLTHFRTLGFLYYIDIRER